MNSKTMQKFELSKEDVQTAVSEFIEKRFGKGGPVKVDVGVRIKTTGYGTAEHDTHVAEVTAVRDALPVDMPAGLEGGYDPVRDEKKEFSMEEFLSLARQELGEYVSVLGGQNDFTRGRHTWGEWFKQFHEYMSW